MAIDSLELIRRLHAHRAWVNGLLLSAAAQLPEEQLHQSFEIGQGTIWKSLTHLYGGEYVWLEALHGVERPVAPGDSPDKLPGNQQADGAMTSLAELRSAWNELEQRWHRFVSSRAGRVGRGSGLSTELEIGIPGEGLARRKGSTRNKPDSPLSSLRLDSPTRRSS
jgi:hypothetical protein